jgi:hypothetical protein
VRSGRHLVHNARLIGRLIGRLRFAPLIFVHY